jgi:hypothetical protein
MTPISRCADAAGDGRKKEPHNGGSMDFLLLSGFFLQRRLLLPHPLCFSALSRTATGITIGARAYEGSQAGASGSATQVSA